MNRSASSDKKINNLHIFVFFLDKTQSKDTK